ncbi:MAG TPA: FAD-dependent oxidoreductase [Aliidongia sp.]|nr:FAD-dependent oxidoreductase [Aliidongia sp.]
MTHSLAGEQAVVIGAGIGGLAAAGALAEHFDRVILFERDVLTDAAISRSGTPQDKHLHALMSGGERALSELFPGFTQDLVTNGAVPLRVGLDIRDERPGFDPFPVRDLGWSAYALSRPSIELTLRRRVTKLRNVVLRSGCRVQQILAADDDRIAGIRYETREGQCEMVPADLVVDASGRGAPTLALLGTLGLAPPEETVIGVEIHYATANFAIPPGTLTGWKAVVTRGTVEDGRFGVMSSLEGNRWMVSIGGRGDVRPPADIDGFMDYVRRLRTPTIYHAIRDAERLSGIARYGLTENVRRHFERLNRFPRGLLPLGDAICRFNPIYGQGMSVAAMEAGVLHRLLRQRRLDRAPLADLTSAFLAEAATLIETPWNLSAIPDFAFPSTRGDRPADLERRLALSGAVSRLAARDPSIHKLMLEVQHLLKPPSVYGEPALQQRILAEI